MITRRSFLKFVSGSFLAGLAVIGYGTGVEAMAQPRVTRYRLAPSNWPNGLKIRAVLLADFHACDPWMSVGRMTQICDQANALEGDMILLLGDYVAGTKLVTGMIDSSVWAKVLSRLKAPLGVHAVLGNHDHWQDLPFQRDPTVKTFAERALTDVGIPVYINRAVQLKKDGTQFWLAGLGDQMALRPGKSFGRKNWGGIDDLDAVLASVTDEAPIILMAHEPDIFVGMNPRVSVTLSGHTHGGQINIMGWIPFLPSRYGGRYARGWFRENNTELVVSAGLGCTGIPLRIGARPEIVVLEIG